MNVLVTGGSGFIGSHLVNALKKYADVTILDIKTPKIKDVNFVKCDIRDRTTLLNIFSKNSFDSVFHLAALVSVPLSVEDPVLNHDININGSLNLINTCVKNGVKKFIFSSSSAVYGDTKPPLLESSSTNVLSPYAFSKLIVEDYLRFCNKLYGFNSVSLRYMNVYGPGQYFSSSYSGVISKFINNCLNKKPLTIFGDGSQSRDFIYVSDVVKANLLALNNNQAKNQVFNIGKGVPTSINDLAIQIKKILKSNVKVIYSSKRKGDILHSFADISKANKLLIFKPEINLNDGLKSTIDWFKDVL